jgi:hypothetical protein
MGQQLFPGFIKATIYFSSPEGAGWGETFYFNAPATATFGTIANELVDSRCFYLGSKCNTTLCRIKDLGSPRKVQLFSRARRGQWNDSGTVAAADSANAVILMPYITPAGTKRNVQVGGVPDSGLARTDADATFHLLGVSSEYLGAWYDFLLAGAYKLQVRERIHTGNFAWAKIQSISVHTNGRYKIVTVDPFSGTTGDQVSFQGLKGGINLGGLQGVRKIIDDIDDVTFTVDRGPRQDLGPPVYLGGGQVSVVQYAMSPAGATDQPYVVSTRNRGRVFTRRRGRRSNKQK